MAMRKDLEIAADHGECAVCFGHLCTAGASVLTDGKGRAANASMSEILPGRTCRHFFCQECAPTFKPKKCPVCRQDFVATFNVPDPLVDPKRWFAIVDIDGDGAIEKAELVDALKGMLPVEPRVVEDMIDESWASWDANGDGRLSASEFHHILAPFLSATLANLSRRINPGVPNLLEQPTEWFEMWDTDGSGSLDRAEIVRALIKTIPGFNGNNEEMLEVSFSNIWCVIDLNNDGVVTIEEFCADGGLRDTLRANFNFGGYT